MYVQSGLFTHMVLQRTSRNISHAKISGICLADGVVEILVRSGKKIMRGFNWLPAGSARKKAFTAMLEGLPSGGPYDVELRIRNRVGAVVEAVSVSDVLVGDVWVLAGQSNMEGVGWLEHALKPIASVRAFYMDNTWDVARDPLHNLWCAHAPVHAADPTTPRCAKNRRWAVGSGVSFGQSMFTATQVPQGVIACAHGGTSMQQWEPAKKKLGNKSLYGAMLERVRLNGGRVRGVLWYQGCNDTNAESLRFYKPRMKKMIASMRKDFNNANLPVVMAQIGRFFFGAGNGEYWNAIQEQQRTLPTLIKKLSLVPTLDLPMDDGIHLGGEGQNILGRRFAYAMRVLLDGKKAGRPPIEIESIVGDLDIRRFLYTVTVTFRNLVGGLTAKGEPTGFNHFGLPNKVFRTTLQGDRAILMISGIERELREKGLQYGYGFQPYCNITDEAGRPVPAFGPLPIDLTPVERWQQATFYQVMFSDEADKTIRQMSCPTGWGTAQNVTGPSLDSFTPLCPWQTCNRPVAGIALYRFRYNSPSSRAIRLHVGYDGPVKIWHDGRECLCDMRGCRPAQPDDKSITLRANKGMHDIVVALGARDGWTSGLFLILEDTLKAKTRLAFAAAMK